MQLIHTPGILRQGLISVLRGTGAVQVCSVISTVDEALRELDSRTCDVVVLSYEAVQDDPGVEVLRLLTDYPTLKILVVFARPINANIVGPLLQAGAMGCMHTEIGEQDMLTAIEKVARGEVSLPGSILTALVDTYIRTTGTGKKNPDRVLTRRQIEIMKLLAEGHQSRDIAHRLSISTRTVDTHRYHIMRRLKLRGMADLTRVAMQHGIADLHDEGRK